MRCHIILHVSAIASTPNTQSVVASQQVAYGSPKLVPLETRARPKLKSLSH